MSSKVTWFYVITSNCFVAYVTLHTKSRNAFCVNTVIVESKRFEIMEKFNSSKTLLKLAGGGGASPTSPPPRSATAEDP